MAKLKCPKCPEFDGFCMSSSQPLFRVAPYEWCRKNLDGLEVVNDTISLSAGLFLSIVRKAYSDAYNGAIRMEFNRDLKGKDYPLSIDLRDPSKLEELGLLGGDD